VSAGREKGNRVIPTVREHPAARSVGIAGRFHRARRDASASSRWSISSAASSSARMDSSRNTSSSIMSSSTAAAADAGGGTCGVPGLGLTLFADAPEGARGGGPRRLPPRPPEFIAGLEGRRWDREGEREAGSAGTETGGSRHYWRGRV
jgi:hypothetical protein